MDTAIVLFTRDLRVHDQPALAEAVQSAERVVPLFVFDRVLMERFAAPNRAAFLHEAMQDLATALRQRGGALVLRSGDVVLETMRVAQETDARAIYLSEDVSAYARTRERRLRHAAEAQRIEVRAFPGATVIPAGDLVPASGDHYRVFTPYWRRWRSAPRRTLLDAPRRVRVPNGLRLGRMPALARLVRGPVSPERARGGQSEGRRRLARWAQHGLRDYGRLHDDLAADATSRLSPHLHFGCVSPLDVLERVVDRDGAEPFVRQLAWRDFYLQLLAANPKTSREDLRPRRDRWRQDDVGARGLATGPYRASRSWTPGCASSDARVGCTTAHGLSRARS